MTNAAAIFRRSVILLYVLLFGTASVYAQGTMGQVADPMNSKQLAKYLKRYVNPTFDQWIVIEDIHSDYLEEFSALRDGPITDFLEEARALSSSGGVPDMESVKKYLASQERVNDRIRRLDEQCFNSMVAVLQADQIAGLQRARLARKRARFRSGMVTQSLGPMGGDLWEVLEEVDFDKGEMTVLLARLRPYEESATRISKKQNEAAGSILLRIVEELEARGFADIDLSDPANQNPEVMRNQMAAVQAGYKNAMEESGEASADLRSLNYRTLRGLTNVGDPWKVLEVKRKWINGAGFGMRYGRPNPLAISEEGATEEWTSFEGLAKALHEKEELLGDLRDSVNELIQAYVIEEHTRTDRVLKIISEFDPMMEALAQAEQLFAETDPEADGELSLEEQVAEIEEARQKAGRERSRQLFALIEEQGSPQLKDQIKDPRFLVRAHEFDTFDADQLESLDSYTLDSYAEEELDSGDSVEYVTTGTQVESRDWISDAMNISIIGKIQQRAGDEVWVQAVLESLHEEYLDDWKSQVVPLQTQLREATSSIYTQESENETGVGFNDVAFKKQYQLRRQLLNTTANVDERFFDNLLLAMPDESADAMTVLRAERAMERSLGGGASGLSPFPGLSNAHYANPIKVLNEMDLGTEHRLKVDKAILSLQKSLIDSQQALQVMASEIERSVVESQKSFYESSDEMSQDEAANFMTEYQRIRRESLEKIEPFETEVRKHREALMRLVAESVSEEVNQQFIEAYRIASHPSIYRDVNSAKPAMEGALRIADLSPSQEEQIQELLAEYEQDWLQRSHRMAEAEAEYGDGDFMTPEGQQAFMAANMKMERARFDRDELAARKLRQLARILRADQRRYIHALRGIEDEIGDDSLQSSEASAMVE